MKCRLRRPKPSASCELAQVDEERKRSWNVRTGSEVPSTIVGIFEFVRVTPIVHLKHLPAYVLVKLTRTRAKKLEGLEETVIPVEVASEKMKFQFQDRDGHFVSRTVTRNQFPMTPSYAFTDYRSQGQTIPLVIVDIAKPPTGTLSLFNLYVALSRSSGRSTIILLRDFDQRMFKRGAK
jgi:hypothetical protein